jgi:hypothetical protein
MKPKPPLPPSSADCAEKVTLRRVMIFISHLVLWRRIFHRASFTAFILARNAQHTAFKYAMRHDVLSRFHGLLKNIAPDFKEM